MLSFPSEYSARAPETQGLKMSTPTFFHLYRDTHLSTTMVYTVACDKASPRSPCFPSYFMAHFSRVIHDNSNKKLKMPTKLAQPPSPSFSQSHSKHRSFMGWQRPPYCDGLLCLIWVIASSSSTSSSKITFYSHESRHDTSLVHCDSCDCLRHPESQESIRVIHRYTPSA